MGIDAAHEEGVGRIIPKGEPQADGAATMKGTGQKMGLTTAGG